MLISDRARTLHVAEVAPRVLAALVLVLAVQQVVLALLLHVGVPATVVRGARYTKELLLTALVAAAVVAMWDRRRDPGRPVFVAVRRGSVDSVDLAVAAWVAFVTVHLVLGVVAGDLLSSRVTDDPRLNLVAYRALVVGPLVLVAVRTIDMTAAGRRVVLRVLLATCGVLAGVAVVEAAFPDAAEWVSRRVLDVPGYREALFGVATGPDVIVRTTVAEGVVVTRAGSLLLDYLQLGYFLMPALVLLVLRTVRSRSGVPWRSLGLAALVGLGILATGTRSVLLAGVAALATVGLSLRDPTARRRLGRLALVGLVVAAVVAVPTGVASRLVSGLGAGDHSTSLHEDALLLGVETVADHPLGLGLASTAEVGGRTDAVSIIVENAYLDIAIQTGIAGLVLFGGLLVALVRALWDRRLTEPLAIPALALVVGLSVGSLFVHAWLMFETAIVVTAVAGLALARQP